MSRQIIFTQKAVIPPVVYSQAVKANGLVFLLGTLRKILLQVQSMVQRFKSKLDSVLKTQ